MTNLLADATKQSSPEDQWEERALIHPYYGLMVNWVVFTVKFRIVIEQQLEQENADSDEQAQRIGQVDMSYMGRSLLFFRQQSPAIGNRACSDGRNYDTSKHRRFRF